MQKSTLGLYMQKVAEGDTSFAGRLCAQLADRLVYIPTKAQAKSGQAVKVSIVRLFENGTYVVPVFTTEKKLRDWSTLSGRSADSISLLGADFCSALDGETSLSVDPGSEPSVNLGPDFVREISMSGASGDYGEIAASAVEQAKVSHAPSPASEPPSSSSLSSFPVSPVTEPSPVPQPSAPLRAARKEEFPPFVPPSAQPAEPQRQTQRGIEQREPVIGETIRAHRSSLAAGALLSSEETGTKESVALAREDSSEAAPVDPPTEPSSEGKKKGLFGLFSKK